MAGSDDYWVEGRRWDLVKHGVYPGPFWDVLDLKGDLERCRRSGRLYLPHERWVQWVSKYEVHYRVDGGRTWHPLGVMQGNRDATSEVAHDVRGRRHGHRHGPARAHSPPRVAQRLVAQRGVRTAPARARARSAPLRV